MVQRRAVMGGVAVSTITVLAGCLGYTVAETEDLEGMEATIEDKNGTITDREETIEELEAEIDQHERQKRRLERNLEEDQETRHEQFVDMYEHATIMIDTAEEWFSLGRDHFDAADYHEADRHYTGAFMYVTATGVVLTDLDDFLTDYDQSDAAEITRVALSYATALSDAGMHLSDASLEYARGNQQQGDSYLRRARNELEAAEEYDIETVRTFQNALEE